MKSNFNTMEIKYVKCIISKINDFTIGKIYNWPDHKAKIAFLEEELKNLSKEE